MNKLLKWLDRNFLLVATAFLLVFIPAYPKLPLADLIEGYIVRLRAEDLAVLVVFVMWFIQLLRRRVKLPVGKLAVFIYAYLIVGFLSTLSAIFITRTVPLEQHHVFKLYLHYFRRVEYFSLFFVAYSSVRTKRDLKLMLVAAAATLLGVVLYGFGQKYLLWPAFSTMNREFSKGTRLYLTPNSRVMSTFAGHYDYAAYLMMALVFLVTGLWLVKRRLLQLALLLLTIGAYWSLILTASRTSFLGYLFGITLVAALLIQRLGWWRVLWRWLLTVILSLFVMLTMGDLSDRFFQVLNNPDLLVHDITQITPIKREWITHPLSILKGQADNLQAAKAKLNKPVTTPGPDMIASDDSGVAAVSDTPPTAIPPDITPEEDALRKALEATASATASATTDSGYSENALKYGLSIAIRLDALWPRAIEGFKRNPLLGSGYSTLVKVENEEFTQAESTDNDYLRMLGETGLLGSVTFLGAVLLVLVLGFSIYRHAPAGYQILGVGTVGVVAALLINATYIDVFESSKIAYVFWLLAALLLRTRELVVKPQTKQKP